MKTFTFIFTILLLAFVTTENLAAQSTIFPFGASWKYIDDGSNQGSGWNTITFDDNGWKTGNGKFGYGTGDIATTVYYGPKSSPKYITTYFRKSFYLSDPAAFSSYITSISRDDGVVVFVNGTEVFRDNMPSGNIDFQTLALDGASDDGRVIHTFTIAPSAFVKGDNVIAVEVHQSKASSSDLAFDLELAASTLAVNHYSLVTSVTGSGTIGKSPEQATYASGESVTITAIPSTGHTFAGWSGDASGTANPLTVSMDRDKAITALFTASTGEQKVTGFVLVNSANEQDIQPIENGAVIQLSSLPSSKLNIRANTSPYSVGSVMLELSGAQSKSYTDNAAPYALHGDDGNGNYYYGNWNPPATGTYTLKATPYSGSKGTGTAGVPLTVSFTIAAEQNETPTDLTPPNVTSIKRQNPTTSVTDATSVTFRVLFSEEVSGVDMADFIPIIISGPLSASVSSVAQAGSSATTYDVTVGLTGGSGTLRLDLRSSGTGIKDKAGNLIAGGYTSGETYTIETSTSSPEGFASVTPLSPLPIHTSLGDQPQSKVWSYAGKWWAVLPTTGEGTHIWRLDGKTWTKVLAISPSDYTRADCKVQGNNAHILLYRGASLPSQLVSVEYSSVSGNYAPWSQRASNVSLSLDAGVKTATIDIDGTGRMWLASNGNNNAYVRWSDAPYTNWSAPVTVATGLTSDDICAIIAMPKANKMGLLWSNQNTKRFGFKTHTDGTTPSTWSADEVPASQSAIESADGMADDHLNMALASDGTLYCAVKTGFKTGLPRIALLVRRPSGTWDDLYEVSKAGNRPIVILNETIGKVKVLYAAPSAGGIYYKESSTSNIAFGSELSLINETCDYATSSKENYSSEIVIFASTSKQSYSVLATDKISDEQTVTSIKEILKEDAQPMANLMAYPNPFSKRTKIQFTLSEGGPYTVEVYDGRGALIDVLKQGSGSAGEELKLELDGTTFTEGLYVVRLVSKAQSSSLKLLLKR
ncbi:InlB B-repeat-containing protein [Pontibacter litorisediminis]|uniref:InlB B-repeat-containing protein n=1 Tax=Pontibacter litorisediminis TaxID=1846260 RepID=UPI0023EC1844|nr:T9SS type A sorting domain-containing protein [Pontibacter litorisediminis]